MLIKHLNSASTKEEEYDNSEWGPEAAMAMCKEVAGLAAPVGNGKIMTLGDLIEQTPKDLISKVVLEEKVFETWYSGRTVLLGDGNIITHLQSNECIAKGP